MGTAWCGPACQVVWGLGERFPRLPDWAKFVHVTLLVLQGMTQVLLHPNLLSWVHYVLSACWTILS